MEASLIEKFEISLVNGRFNAGSNRDSLSTDTLRVQGGTAIKQSVNNKRYVAHNQAKRVKSDAHGARAGQLSRRVETKRWENKSQWTKSHVGIGELKRSKAGEVHIARSTLDG